MLAQALLPGPATRRFGERGSAMLGLLADGCAYVLIAFATQGWMAFPILLPLALGGLVVPALQALLSQQAGASRQGQLQGSLASLAGLTSVIGPLCVTALYAAPGQGWNGWPWLAGAALNQPDWRCCCGGPNPRATCPPETSRRRRDSDSDKPLRGPPSKDRSGERDRPAYTGLTVHLQGDSP